MALQGGLLAISLTGPATVTGTAAVALAGPILVAAGTFSTTGGGAVAIIRPALAAAGFFAGGSGAVALARPVMVGSGGFTGVPIPPPIIGTMVPITRLGALMEVHLRTTGTVVAPRVTGAATKLTRHVGTMTATL